MGWVEDYDDVGEFQFLIKFGENQPGPLQEIEGTEFIPKQKEEKDRGKLIQDQIIKQSSDLMYLLDTEQSVPCAMLLISICSMPLTLYL